MESPCDSECREVPVDRAGRPPQGTGGAIISRLADIPAFAEILSAFVAGLPGKLAAMRSAHRAGRHDELRSLAHQMKGAGGGYGYPSLSEAAAALESAAKAPDAAEPAALDELAELCSRIARGYPTGTSARRAPC